MRARTRPRSSPPPPTSRKLRPASHTENAPLTTAATAALKATSPVPSLTRLSPPTTVPTRSGTPSLAKIASAATGSVGARIAPKTKAVAQGSPIRALRDHRDYESGGEHKANGEQHDRPEVGAQIERRG